MDNSVLLEALKISGIGIVVLLLVLVLLAFLVSLMTKFIVEKPETETAIEPETPQPAQTKQAEKKSDLKKIAVLAVALARAQAETTYTESPTPAGVQNAWLQFNLQRRLTQSSNLRRSR